MATPTGQFKKNTKNKKKTEYSKSQRLSNTPTVPLNMPARYNQDNSQEFDQPLENQDNQTLGQDMPEPEQEPDRLKNLYDKQTLARKAKQASKPSKLNRQASMIAKGKSLEEKVRRASKLYKGIKIGSACTVVGIIITFLVMNFQLIMSGVEVSKDRKLPFLSGMGANFNVNYIPALALWEFILLLLVWLILILVFIIVIIILYVYAHCNGLTVIAGFLNISDICPIFK